MKRLLIAAAVIGLVATACGSDDAANDQGTVTAVAPAPEGTDPVTEATRPITSTAGVADEQDYVDAAAASLGFSDEDIAACIGQATVDAVGYDAILATGLTPDELFAQPLTESGLSIPEDREASTKEAVAGCGDLVGLYNEEGATSDAERACVEKHMTNELVGEIFVTVLGDVAVSDELQAASDAMDACIAENS